MICKSCGAENSNRAKFCGKCGRNLQSGEKNTYSNKEKKKRKNPLGMILVIILCTFLLSAGLFVIIQRKQIKENPYDFNPIEEKITAAFDWVTGNKNSISVSDDMKDMKYLSERIARTLLRQMGKGKEWGEPDDICDMAENFTDIKSGKIEYIDYFEDLNNDSFREMQEQVETIEDDLIQSCIPIIVGRIEGADSLAFTSIFHRKMIVKKEEQIQDSVWILHDTEQFSIGIVFTEEESEISVDAYPIATENMKEFYDDIELFFGIHERYR